MKVIGLRKSEIDNLSLADINGYMQVMDSQSKTVTETKREKNQVPAKPLWDNWTRRGRRG